MKRSEPSRRGHREETFETTVDMDMDAFIPSAYIKNEVQKLTFIRGLPVLRMKKSLWIYRRLLDRYGDLPQSVNNLLIISLIKSMCNSVYIQSLVQKDYDVKLVMYPKAKINVERIPELMKKYPNNLKFSHNPPLFFLQASKAAQRKG